MGKNNLHKHLSLSIIIAVYERHDELNELLLSLVEQKCKAFEVIIIDDGSTNPLRELVNSFTNQLDIKYFFKDNSGPGMSRNYGMAQAKGNYFIFLDSDTILPTNYICEVRKELSIEYVEFFGGSDSASESFNDLQKAISFSMTSVLTTGGIRGGKEKVGKFQPRSFNMGLSKRAFEVSRGFGEMRVGEDPDLTMTLWEKGFKSRWFPKATVYHKRRSTIVGFAKQVQSFGKARPILNQKHPKYASITFWFPSVFIIGLFLALLMSVIGFYLPIMLYMIYFLSVFSLSTWQNKSIKVGMLSMLTTFIQFYNYGIGFLSAQWKLNVLGKNPKDAFPNHFYLKN